MKKADSSWSNQKASFDNFRDDIDFQKDLTFYQDLLDRKMYEQNIDYLAHHDYLTGLPNRYALEKLLSQEMEQARRTNQTLALIYIDLDRFKIINECLSHRTGDSLLKEVTRRLKCCLDDSCFLFRQGGDEFIILIPESSKTCSIEVSIRVLEELAIPIIINDIDFVTSASIGISLFPNHGETVEQIIRNADFAMYQAKKNGGNTYHIYSEKNLINHINPLTMELELRKALERNELVLHYQPKINLHTGEMIGAEALIRWNHPVWGIVLPNDFISMAEETGLIVPIGKWVIKTACKQNKIWHDLGVRTVIAVNLSLKQFNDSKLVQTIAAILDETKLEPHFLELEITETVTANIEHTLPTLHALKNLGVKISIDDFGTGFSSLYYLKKFPVDALKIDQSFIRDLFIQSQDDTIVKTIIAMAHNLKLNVIAEGIETKEQLVFLQQHFCNEGQGYYFSKPMRAIDIENNFLINRKFEKLTHSK